MIVISAQAFPPRPGGIQNLLAGMAEHIAKAGYQVTVLADGGRAEKTWDDTTELPYKVERFSGPRPLRRMLKARRLAKLIKGGQVQAIYTDSWKSLEALPETHAIPVITWAHGNEFAKCDTKGARIRLNLAKATHIFFISNDTKDRAEAVRPDGVDFSIQHPPIQPAEVPSSEDLRRAEQVWSNGSPRLLSLSRLVELKGLDHTIRALPSVLEVFPDTKYVIAGTGDHQARLEELVLELGLDTVVDFVGWVGGSYKTALIQSADLFLQPGRQVGLEREGYGISYVEAALEGVPTICGNAGGAPEAVIDEITGLVIDASSAGTVEKAILAILEDKDLHARMKDSARTHGQTCLWPNCIGQILAPAGLSPLVDQNNVTEHKPG